jgi:hypothetical protein
MCPGVNQDVNQDLNQKMTSKSVQSVTCALCGAVSHPILPAAAPAAPARDPAPDFDTRPGEPVRSTLLSWVQQCRACGYAAGSLAELADGVREVVSSAEYRRLVRDPAAPAQARPFLCYAYILERLEAYPDAGWCALHAAWACDDLSEESAARGCRARAIDLWKRGKHLGAGFMDSHEEEFAVVADVCRRLGQFEEARMACNAALDGPPLPPGIDAMLRRQLVLIARGDRSAHSMEELAGSRG